MTEALITGAVAILVCMINNYYTHREAEKKHDKVVALLEYRLDQLTKQVEKHNSVIERTYKLEQEGALLEEKIRVANHRIEDLEKKKEDDKK